MDVPITVKKMINENDIFFKYQIENFYLHKENIISLIKTAEGITTNEGGECVSYTDRYQGDNNKRKYVKYLEKNILKKFFKSFTNDNNLKTITVENLWFHLYKKNSYDSPHTHPGANFTNILYVSLPNKNVNTKIFTLSKKQLNIEINEGMILSFPGFLPHGSPINTCNDEKIIISFNTNVTI